MFYKYRLDESPYARRIVRQAILDSTLNNKRTIFDQSFNDSVADFLIVRLFEEDKKLLSAKEKQSILKWIKNRIVFGLKAKDTENRAAIAGVYWYYIGAYLYNNNILTDDECQKTQKLMSWKRH